MFMNDGLAKHQEKRIMANVRVIPSEQFRRQFVPAEHLPPNQDEFYLRNQQLGRQPAWRHLQAHEIETLVKNANTCDNWDLFLVADPFDPRLIRSSEFSGLVRIARLEAVMLEHHDMQMPAGISDSMLISCDVGENAAIHNVRYLAHYIVGDNVMLLNTSEMHTTNHAKFGNCIVKDGEPEDVRVWLDLVNETGTRAVMAFDGMIAADAYIWSKYRDDAALQRQLREITQRQFDSRRGFYGTVGAGSVVKNCQILKDVKIGPACYVKGANKLKNLTINSTDDEPTQIGEGVEMINGIVGLGCHVFYGCKAVRFVMGNNSNLKYGARLIHSYLGDNSTVSCCELLNNLIFPAHEQHHNNSFLVASLVLGQSNLAAGATIGSNHNSRANDGEIVAGRGFWPGLCTTLKHCCRFASFALLVKGDYPAELNVPLPFCLLNDDRGNDRLLVIPAYWWLYNMYALARNTWKFTTRDRRKTKTQHVEFDCLAPDTAEEIFVGLRLLEIWAGKARLRADGRAGDCPSFRVSENGTVPLDAHIAEAELADLGRAMLTAPATGAADPEILGENMEASRRPVVILKARQAYAAYREMLHYYAVKNLLAYMEANPDATCQTMCRDLAAPREKNWVNLGGQLAPEPEVERLLDDIKAGRLKNWQEIHGRYDEMWQDYPRRKQAHALAALLELLGGGDCPDFRASGDCPDFRGSENGTVPFGPLNPEDLAPPLWNAALDEAVRIQEYVRDQVYISRKKDYDNPFRQITFRNAEEMKAVLGTAEDNGFVKQVRQETEAFKRQVASVKARG